MLRTNFRRYAVRSSCGTCPLLATAASTEGTVRNLDGMGRRCSARLCKADPEQQEAEEEEEEEEDGAEERLEVPAGRNKRQRVDASAAGGPVTAQLYFDGLSGC